MRLIGRKEEQNELRLCEKSKKSELVCVYGRRRVGKTFLIEQTFGSCFAFHATGLEDGNKRQQLRSFHQRLCEFGDENKKAPRDWFEAFSRLDCILSKDEVILSPNNKKIVFLDEFPWFSTNKSEFLMAFSEFWNRKGTQNGDLLFIICGSATSWIIKNILNDTGSLYHRVTRQIFLSPFSLKESELYFRDREFGWSREQILECQMVFGGLPYFFDLMNNEESFKQNVNHLMFRPFSLLQGESNRLLEATLSKSPVYADILEELSKHIYGMKKSECQNVLKLSNGTFFRAADDLIKCGYVHEYRRDYEKSKPVYIQIQDPFLLFHFHFLTREKRITCFDELTDNPGRYMNWRGHAFDILCQYHFKEIKAALGISGVKTKHYPWMVDDENGGAQIDLVIERDDKITDLCEMKCTDKPFAISSQTEHELQRKRDVFREHTKTKQALKLVLITSSGIAGMLHAEHISQVITIDDLFEN